MNKSIMFSIVGIIFLIGSVIAGGVVLSERTAILTPSEKTELVSKGITDVQVTQLNCKESYCTFWIKKTNVVNSERRIEMYKDVCTTPIIKTDKEICDDPVCRIEYGKEICTEAPIVESPIEGLEGEVIEKPIDSKPICTREETEVCEKAVCKIIVEETEGETTCIKVLKTDVELVNERNNVVDELLKQISNDITATKTKAPSVVKATDEKVVVNK